MDKIEQRILEIIDQNREKIIAFGDDIWYHAELGYMEHRTAGKVADFIKEQGLVPQTGIAETGVKAYLKPPKDGELRIALMGELDALPFPEHKDANPETGAAHCCGHNAQITGVMGALLALQDPEVLASLGDANIAFMAVPSEEGGSPKDLPRLREEGRLTYCGGKQEFIARGIMDDINLTVGHHNTDDGVLACPNAPSMGFMEKYIRYIGTQAHPGRAHGAIDAMKTANLAMTTIDAQRESLHNLQGSVKYILHGYILKGGNAANVISDLVDMDYNLHAITSGALQDMAYRVDRSAKAAAIALGAGMELKTEPGYLPVVPLKDVSFMEEVFDVIDPGHKYEHLIYDPKNKISGTTDYGDLSSIMPVIQFMTGGAGGMAHNNSYCITDKEQYYINSAKGFAVLAYRLLKDHAALAKRLIDENPPKYTKEAYLEIINSFHKVETMDMVPVPDFENPR